MREISAPDIQARIGRDNPWWAESDRRTPEAGYPRRVYFAPFKALALNFNVRRAAVLLGPRRVGKTVMIKQVLHEAIADGFPARNVLYASIDTPLYSSLTLEAAVVQFVCTQRHSIVTWWAAMSRRTSTGLG